MPGPAPKPTKVKKLEGNPGKRPLKTNEPEPADESMPTQPKGMPEPARNAWKRLAPQMHHMGILTHLDRDALESYCRLYAAARQCWRQVGETGGPVVMIGGKPQANPHIREAHRLESLLNKVRSELGLNATSRSRIDTNPAEKEEDLDNFLKFDQAA